jgi:archaellum component FlaC
LEKKTDTLERKIGESAAASQSMGKGIWNQINKLKEEDSKVCETLGTIKADIENIKAVLANQPTHATFAEQLNRLEDKMGSNL